MRLLMDNLGFSIQSMSINIREGVDYNQTGCSNNKDCIQFMPIDSWLSNPPGNPVCYSLDVNSLRKCEVTGSSACPCSYDSGSALTSPEIKIKNLKFTIVPEPNLSNSLVQKKVKIIIAGEAGTVSRDLTNFFIQNTVSQRSVGN